MVLSERDKYLLFRFGNEKLLFSLAHDVHYFTNYLVKTLLKLLGQ